MQEKGTISIHTENIFPIIKKFLYSDHEIFLRELVANAVDATQKLKKLASIGDFKGELGELKIKISIDEAAKTLTISDRGLGMNAEEIKKYINQIAFSGAAEFVEKFKDEDTQQIIGKFGLGFYSAFMVSQKVELLTRSFRENDEAAVWECDGSTEFSISQAEKTDRGTDVILHIAEDSQEFLDKNRIQSILNKYCRFLPIEIEFDGNTINNTAPIWNRQPNELTDEDYLNFYKELYPMSEDPLFWIHLNVDYPFNLTGILYFPKIKKDLEIQRNKIQLYSRQVFITDEVKDIVPEFLMLLHGVIDSPDIPLNVSRSFLQADGNVKKINAHITKKVADKLGDLFKADRTSFEEKWDSLNIFIKYGMLSDEKFYDRAKDFCLLKNSEEKLFTLEEYKTKVSANQTDKNGQLVYLYSSDEAKQDTFIQTARNRDYDVLLLVDAMIDQHFVGLLERKVEKLSVKRVDSDIVDKLIEKEQTLESVLSEEEKTKVTTVFEKSISDGRMKVAVESLPAEDLPVSVTIPEFMRRMKEMGSMGFMGAFPETFNVVVNANHKLIQKVLAEKEEEKQVALAKQMYDLALLAQNMLSGAELTKFIKRSVEMVG